MAFGTALGSTFDESFFPEPRVAGFSFIGDGVSGAGAADEALILFALAVAPATSFGSISRAIAVIASSACFCATSTDVNSCFGCAADLAACFGFGYSASSCAVDIRSVG